MRYLKNVVSLKLHQDKCTGCRVCIDVCPSGVLEMTGKRASIADRDLCIECGACALNCEFGALEVNSGVGCAAAYINSLIRGGEPSCGCDGDTGSSSCC